MSHDEITFYIQISFPGRYFNVKWRPDASISKMENLTRV